MINHIAESLNQNQSYNQHLTIKFQKLSMKFIQTILINQWNPYETIQEAEKTHMKPIPMRHMRHRTALSRRWTPTMRCSSSWALTQRRPRPAAWRAGSASRSWSAAWRAKASWKLRRKAPRGAEGEGKLGKRLVRLGSEFVNLRYFRLSDT